MKKLAPEGIWEGSYWFLGHEHQDREPVPFKMSLFSAGLFSLFGVVQEDPDRGFAEIGAVCGSAVLWSFSAVKIMPVLRFLDEGGTITFTDYAKRIWERNELPPVPHPPILLRGRFSLSRRSLTGTWRITQSVLRAGSDWQWNLPATEGRWSARLTAGPSAASDFFHHRP